LWAHVCVLALGCLAAACASHRPASLADRFVRQATDQDLEEPDLYDPIAADERGRAADAVPIVLSSEARAAAALVERTGFKPAESTGPTVETTNDALADALTSLSGAPSGDRHRRVGAEYRRLKVFDVARRHLDRAIGLNRRDAEAYDERARLWRDAGNPELALGDAHRAVSFAPGSATAHNTLGTVRYALGDGDGARQAFERVLALDASAAYAHNNLCYLAHLRGDDAGALEQCARALALAPDLSVAWNNLGLVHAAAGRMDQAREAFIAGSGRAHGLYNVGIAYLARREYGDAAEAFDAALREQPEMMDAVRRAAEARALADARDGGGAAVSLARSRK
jgi:tetratricopeptide (TPR) repeat protein